MAFIGGGIFLSMRVTSFDSSPSPPLLAAPIVFWASVAALISCIRASASAFASAAPVSALALASAAVCSARARALSACILIITATSVSPAALAVAVPYSSKGMPERGLRSAVVASSLPSSDFTYPWPSPEHPRVLWEHPTHSHARRHPHAGCRAGGAGAAGNPRETAANSRDRLGKTTGQQREGSRASHGRRHGNLARNVLAAPAAPAVASAASEGGEHRGAEPRR
jgi:hypothetical protein